MNNNTVSLPETAAMPRAFNQPHEAIHPGQAVASKVGYAA